jgi:hypothetical protein
VGFCRFASLVEVMQEQSLEVTTFHLLKQDLRELLCLTLDRRSSLVSGSEAVGDDSEGA